jgi:hypothetical protein
MAEGLAESQWLNLEKKTNESYYGQKKLLDYGRQRRDRRRDRNGGISRRYFFAYPSLSCFLAIAQRRIALLLRCVTHLASGLGYCTLNARRRTALSALDRFYAHRAFGLSMAERSQISDQTGDPLEVRRSEAWPSLTIPSLKENPQ